MRLNMRTTAINRRNSIQIDEEGRSSWSLLEIKMKAGDTVVGRGAEEPD